ncbi:hypothetical protein JOB18_047193 [Solea senegalensis]|uniref:Uncharacterized protein n=1 Tax=Solea senegalensis TaxID=28829 RepID=A0AAV6S3Z4_SOLSE|nr:hypothetical protein JOB18_047193 [Solea senegalensis]
MAPGHIWRELPATCLLSLRLSKATFTSGPEEKGSPVYESMRATVASATLKLSARLDHSNALRVLNMFTESCEEINDLSSQQQVISPLIDLTVFVFGFKSADSVGFNSPLIRH